jgi:hypothetical protein
MSTESRLEDPIHKEIVLGDLTMVRDEEGAMSKRKPYAQTVLGKDSNRHNRMNRDIKS